MKRVCKLDGCEVEFEVTRKDRVYCGHPHVQLASQRRIAAERRAKERDTLERLRRIREA